MHVVRKTREFILTYVIFVLSILLRSKGIDPLPLLQSPSDYEAKLERKKSQSTQVGVFIKRNEGFCFFIFVNKEFYLHLHTALIG